jgi:dienelactone hydrolase
MRLEWLDQDRRAVFDAIRARSDVNGRICVAGWWFGGHLALRAALEPDVRAAACFCATSGHDPAATDHALEAMVALFAKTL